MRLQKLIAAAIAVAMTVGTMSAPASAQQSQQRQGPGVIPTLLGPIGAAALFPTTNAFHWTTTKSFWIKIPVKKYPTMQSRFIHKKKYKWVKINKTKHHSRTSSNVGKAVVGCIFGSALATIAASVRKASAMGNPPRWRSQAEHEKILASGVEKKYELTLDEANTAMAFCGLGSFTLNW
jgi:hypothetical protein